MPIGGYRAALAAGGFTLLVPNLTTNPNFYNLAVAAGYLGGPATIIIPAGFAVYATTTGNYGARTGTGWAGGTNLTIINLGFIDGCGGSGANAGTNPPAAGGPAFYAEVPCKFDNNAGSLRGGGGGGGMGTNINNQSGCVCGVGAGGGGGGGGQGRQFGYGGAGFDYLGALGSPGTNGSLSAPGSGGAGCFQPYDSSQGGAGGSGGTWGSAGSNGSDAIDGIPCYSYLHFGNYLTGAAGGASVVGNSNITWLATGTRLGAVT